MIIFERSQRKILMQVGRGFVYGAWLLLAVPGVSSAQPSTAASANEVYAEAQKLFDKGQYADALVGFRQAYNASNSPNARLMIGHCLIALGQPHNAYTELAATVEESTQRAAAEPKYEKTRQAAATQLALLESKVAKVVVRIDDPAAEVTVNGMRVAPEKRGSAMAVEPGTVNVVGKYPDGEIVTMTRVIPAGKTDAVVLEHAAATKSSKGTDASAPNETSDKPIETSSGGGVRIAGGVVLGAGVAGMVVFAVAGSMAKSNFATLETECGGQRCMDLKYADVIDQGKTYTTVANVGFGVGVAGIVAGGLMVILGGASKTSPPPVAVSVFPGGTSVTYKLAF